ncbi:ribonuclease M5 [Fundicoccus culcitae]|uniref:Ribonuclease M5 n=1 Tax=Fundicoccus culcitae TaxID=2969821 RepID=A0ABY5P2G0_9LACT|nr:ribonuclease M5 [Fundicoccus culcitae]UUX32892.1 ribonuclease M5 [Fundicoccus culcitae]
MEKNQIHIPREVIVVEGRDDSKRLMEVFGPKVKLIETGGSAINAATLERIKQAAEQFGVIVFTDPDVQGQRIRQIITQNVPTAKQAYLSRQDARGKSYVGSLGVEHASKESILKALEELATPASENLQRELSTQELMQLGLTNHPLAGVRRKAVAERFHLGHVNAKQLQKQLALYQVDYAELFEFIEELNHKSE